MNINYVKKYSNALGRDMEYKTYGDKGHPVLVFPSQNGRFYDYQDFDMVAFDELRTEEGKPYYCAFASRRDIYRYRHSHNEVRNRYSGQLMMCERMPELFSAAMGQQMYTVRLNTMDEMQEFIYYVHAKQ